MSPHYCCTLYSNIEPLRTKRNLLIEDIFRTVQCNFKIQIQIQIHAKCNIQFFNVKTGGTLITSFENFKLNLSFL